MPCFSWRMGIDKQSTNKLAKLKKFKMIIIYFKIFINKILLLRKITQFLFHHLDNLKNLFCSDIFIFYLLKCFNEIF